MATNKKTDSHDLDLALGIGVGLAALAGAYFLYGKDGTKRRKKITSWMLKAKGEVLQKIEKMKDVSEETYQDAVQTVMKKYEKLKDVDKTELEALAKDLQGHWKNIKKEIEASTKTVKKGKKVVKKTTKKAVKSIKK